MPLASQMRAKLTYADYLTWPEAARWELIGGEAYDMTPAPTSKHQRVAGRLFFLLEGALQGKACTAFFAPTDVVLSEEDVVQPDVFVVCDRGKITPASIRGAPDLVIEILSPATALKDRRDKKALYERFEVREYLLVDSEAAYVEQFVLSEGRAYGRGEVLGPADLLKLQSLEGLEIALSDVFEIEKREAGTSPSPSTRST